MKDNLWRQTANISRQELCHISRNIFICCKGNSEATTGQHFVTLWNKECQTGQILNSWNMWALYVIKLTQQVSCSRERLKIHAAFYNSDILCSGMVSTMRFFRKFLLTAGVFGSRILDCDVYLSISEEISESHCIFSWKTNTPHDKPQALQLLLLPIFVPDFPKTEWYSFNWNIQQILIPI